MSELTNSGDLDEKIVLQALLDRFFRLCREENHPHTPEITKNLDNLVKVIRKKQIESRRLAP
jgi:hypothetical protein